MHYQGFSMERLARLINRWPALILAGGFVFLAASLIFGTGVFDKLQGGGFDDPNSESTKVTNVLAGNFSRQQFQLLVLFNSDVPVESSAANQEIQSRLNEINQHKQVEQVQSYYSTGQTSFISRDHKQ